MAEIPMQVLRFQARFSSLEALHAPGLGNAKPRMHIERNTLVLMPCHCLISRC